MEREELVVSMIRLNGVPGTLAHSKQSKWGWHEKQGRNPPPPLPVPSAAVPQYCVAAIAQSSS